MSLARLRRPAVAALALVLLVAAALRLVGIDHHLRYGAPDFDERNNFVDPVLRMWNARTADPTVYYGYAGFFNYLIFLPVGLGQALAEETGAYVAARAVVAVFATLNVLLVFVAARPVAGDGAALAGAALLAVARIEVRHAHHITPDILVGTAGLVLLVLTQAAATRRRDVLLGVTVGFATAIKYSGLLLAPAFGLVFLMERRGRALAAAVAGGLIAFALAAPYAVLQRGGEGTGFAGGVATYFGADAEENRFLQGRGTSALAVPGLLQMSLGAPALAVALASLRHGRRPAVAAAWAIVAASVAATIPANLVNPRHVIPAETAAAALFAFGLGVLARRPGIAAAVAALAVVWPVPRTLHLVTRYIRPAAVDQAARWIDREVESPALVVTSLPRLKLDRDHFEVRLVGSLDDVSLDALRHYDVVVATTRRELARLAGMTVRQSFPSEEDHPDRPLTILRPSPPRWPAFRPDRVTPPEAASAVVWDGAPFSCWSVPAGELALEAGWSPPRVLGRIEIEANDWPQPLRLIGLDEEGGQRRLDVDVLRPTRPSRQRAETRPGQIYVLTPALRLAGLRLERGNGLAWELCDVRLFEAAVAPPPE